MLLTVGLIVLGLLILGVFFLLLYSGFFYTYTIRCAIPASLPRRFAYKVIIGPYKNIGSAQCEVYDFVPHLTVFTVYYDNPDEVQNDKLRAIVGCHLPENSKDRCEDSLVKAGYEIETFPQCTKALITEFPYRNMLSILIAVKRVYPSLMEYIKDHSSKIQHYGPFIEICRRDSIQFVVVLEPNEGFTVSKLPPLESSDESKKSR